MSRSFWVTEFDNLKHFIFVLGNFFFKAAYLNLWVCILLNEKLLFAVKQITDLASVNLEKGHVKLAFLAFAQIKDLQNSSFGDVCDRKGLARAGLAIREKSHNAFLKKTGKQGLDLEIINMLTGFLSAICIVELKLMILNVLC